ncbi:hypothetical protein [Thermohalobacter berrensis]|uniref:Phosphatidylglycerophosphatase A n=1 Tax=Thermohalobacter berrensis TaxID=99594 RepID=A0A419T7K1_9FIRM|nr:hypothetical protein [Thermohalobacter berrensis]RKD33409.1 hypothetical protein BET03_09125 [Thermohalobacter berrensis]
MNNLVNKLLNDRGVSLSKIYSLISILKNDEEEKNKAKYKELVSNVLSIKVIQDFIHLGVILDIYAENNLLPDPLQQLIGDKNTYFDLDKVLAISILYEFTPEAIIYYSYLQKEKIDMIRKMLSKNKVNTFLDDIVCVIAATASIDIY